LLIEQLGYVESLLAINWSVSTSSFVMKRDLASKLGGFHNFAMCHDLDFLLRALFIEKAHVGTSNTPTWAYRCHETNSGSTIKISKQHGEIAYCLGRLIDSVPDPIYRDLLIELVDYGLPTGLMENINNKKPWLSEPKHGLEIVLENWLREYEESRI